MRYIFFVTREPWASFNSVYAYIRTKDRIPDEYVALYSDEDSMKNVSNMLNIMYNALGKKLKIEKVRIPDASVEDLAKILENLIEEGDIVDITGARKLMILSLLGIRGIIVVYLYLQDMRFSSLPFMARPLSIQQLVEVEI